MAHQDPNPQRDPAQPQRDVPGQAPHPARDPVPDQPVDPTIPPFRDPGTGPIEPGKNP